MKSVSKLGDNNSIGGLSPTDEKVVNVQGAFPRVKDYVTLADLQERCKYSIGDYTCLAPVYACNEHNSECRNYLITCGRYDDVNELFKIVSSNDILKASITKLHILNVFDGTSNLFKSLVKELPNLLFLSIVTLHLSEDVISCIASIKSLKSLVINTPYYRRDNIRKIEEGHINNLTVSKEARAIADELIAGVAIRNRVISGMK